MLKKIWLLASVVALFGLIMTALSLFIEIRYQINNPYGLLTLEFFKHLGTALISLALIGVIIERPDWQKYFEDRLRKVVMQYDYLKQLEPEQLKALQVATLKAFFKREDINQEGSFLHFFQERIQQLIGSPYRESTDVTITIEKDTNNQYFLYHSRIRCLCQKVGGKFQSGVAWAPQANEFIAVNDVNLTIEIISPSWRRKPVTERIVTLKGAISDDNCKFNLGLQALKDFYEDEAQNGQFNIPLFTFEEHSSIDTLMVTLEGKCTKRLDGFFGWGMSHSTKGFVFTCHFPRDMAIRYELFGIDYPDVESESGQGWLKLNSYTWVLPFSGIAFELTEQSVVEPSGSNTDVVSDQ